MNKKISSFELKLAKSQTNAQKSSKMILSERYVETRSLVSYPGDSRIILESWHVCSSLTPSPTPAPHEKLDTTPGSTSVSSLTFPSN